MNESDEIKSKNKEELINLLCAGSPGSPIHEKIKMGIIVKCTQDIEKAFDRHTQSLDNNAKSSDKLSNKLFWLNVVLVTATVIGVAISIVSFCYNR